VSYIKGSSSSTQLLDQQCCTLCIWQAAVHKAAKAPAPLSLVLQLLLPFCRLWLQAGAGRGVGTAAGSSSSQMLQRVTVESGRVARPASKDRRAEWAVKFKEVPNRDQVGR
jgi:hypothetical protein